MNVSDYLERTLQGATRSTSSEASAWSMLALLSVAGFAACASEEEVDGVDGAAQREGACEFSVGGPMSASNPQALTGMLTVSQMALFGARARDTATETCGALAGDLGAPLEEQDAADAAPDPGARLQAWCSLALDAVAAIESEAGGSFVITVPAPTCAPSLEAGGTCLLLCTGAGTCDPSTSPATCDGAPADARCDANCRVVAASVALCEEPGVAVSWEGPDDPAATDEALDAIAEHVRAMAVLQGQFGTFASALGGLGGVDLQGCDPDCVAPVMEALTSATLDFQACSPVVDEVIRTLAD